jgi:hypothetical protein
MPELRSPSDLARVLGDVVGSEDPIGELRRRGFQFTGDLSKALQGVKPSVSLSVAQRQRFARLAGKSKVTFRVGAPPAQQLRRFAPNDYDVIAGIRLTLTDQILNGLRQTQTIPQQIPLDRLLTQAQRAQLATALSGVFETIPRGSEAGKIFLRDGISTAPLNGTDTVLLSLPFGLEIFHTVTSSEVTRREIVGTLSGKLTLVARLSADVTGLGNPAFAVLAISVTLPPFPEQGVPRLEVDADSPLQPKPSADLPGLALLLQTVLRLFIGASFRVSPFINVPGLPGVRLIVEHVDVRSVATPDGGQLMAGVRFIGAGNTPADPTRLSRLRPDAGRNIVLRVHERYLNAVFERARSIGVLDKKLREESGESKAKVKSTHVKFGPSQIKIILDCVIPDKCGVAGVNFVDFDFTVTQTLNFSLTGGAIRVESLTDVSYSTGDKLACAVLTFVSALVVSLPILLAAPFFGVFTTLFVAGELIDQLGNSGSSGGGNPVSMFPLNKPIPRTELLPVLDQLVTRVGDETLVASAAAGFRPDGINTYIFARVMQSGSQFEGRSGPIAGASVQVCDQDAPPPPGDDVIPPREGETEFTLGNKFLKKSSTVYERPRSDQVLAQGTTDFDGRIMFTLEPAQLGLGAGHVVNTTSSEDLHTHEVETTIRRQQVIETAPDIYFIIRALSDSADTRKTQGGLIVNFRSKKLGTPTAPHILSVRLQPSILK